MTKPTDREPPDRTDAQQQRLDRQLGEVLQEVRIAMPGVQLLFAFLLTVPFNARFDEVSEFQRDVYLVTLVAAGVSSALFIAPAGYHRILFQRGAKPELIAFASRTALWGLATLAVAMSGAVLLVVSFLFDDLTAAIVTGAVGAIFAWLWFGAAWVRRAN